MHRKPLNKMLVTVLGFRKRLLLWFVAILCLILLSVLILFAISGNRISYLPVSSKTENKSEKSFAPDIILRNPWYVLEADQKGAIEVKGATGLTIMSSLEYFSSYSNYCSRFGLINSSAVIVNDSTVLIRGKGSDSSLVRIYLTVCTRLPRLDVAVETQYLADLKVEREALIAEFAVPVSEVYLKNSKLDLKPFESEYWLDRKGVRFGAGENSALIYNTPGISSLQLNTKRNQLIVNLDFEKDHPFIFIPYQKNGEGHWLDKSASEFSKGMTRLNHFELFFGIHQEVIPRLMNVPYGYLAGYVFTEHADGGNIKTQRAAYFGSEKITEITNSTGGFAGHNIPVTKSVFYEDINDGLHNSVNDSINEKQLLDFLDQLYDSGNYELCLHTPENGNSNRAVLEEAIRFMKERYNAISWIDHGMFPGNNNRETIVCDGMDSLSGFYSADLWEKYNTLYFWSSAVEQLRFSVPMVSLKEELKNLRFKVLFSELHRRYEYLKLYDDIGLVGSFIKIMSGSFPTIELNSQQPLYGNSKPTPLYWQNETFTRNFYSWTTEFEYNGITRRLDGENLPVEKRQLDMLIQEQGIFFNHGYYVRNEDADDILCKCEGVLVINPWFDKLLAYMGQKRDDGDLYITTVRDLLNYWRQLENITFDYLPDGTIKVINHSDLPVKGLSVALRTNPNYVRVNGQQPFFRKNGDDTIIWFDLPSNGVAILQATKKQESN